MTRSSNDDYRHLTNRSTRPLASLGAGELYRWLVLAPASATGALPGRVPYLSYHQLK